MTPQKAKFYIILTLQYFKESAVLHCNMRNFAVLYYIIPYYTIVYCTVLYCSVVH